MDALPLSLSLSASAGHGLAWRRASLFLIQRKGGDPLIELSRALAKQFRSVLRRCVLAAQPRGSAPVVLCRVSRQGLSLSCWLGDVALRHHTPGSFRTAGVALPVTVLAQIEGGPGAVVSLEQTGPLRGRASWGTSKVPTPWTSTRRTPRPCPPRRSRQPTP
jgi:hypothetical protein